MFETFALDDSILSTMVFIRMLLNRTCDAFNCSFKIVCLFVLLKRETVHTCSTAVGTTTNVGVHSQLLML